MSFYREQKKAFLDLDEIIKNEVIGNKSPLNISRVILKLTSIHEVSELALKKRVNRWIEAHNDILKEKDGELVFIE
ncbi:MAG: hypothetical protein ACOC1P_00590 [Minisyncoccales bacterium]